MIEYIIGSFLILLLLIKMYDVFKKYKESFKNIFIFEAKVVSTPSTRNKGLMNRKNKLNINLRKKRVCFLEKNIHNSRYLDI